jgi:Fusaric acid resistance protein-like/FUSC-like inner membrane protein yccS
VPSQPPDQTSPERAALTVAVRDAAHFDRSSVSLSGGLLAAIPVVSVLAAGLAIGQPVAGVTLGVGAMLVGIAWRVRGGRPPLGLMATDATVMAISTFVGCVTGAQTWLHLLLLCAWSFVAGLLVVVGNRGGVVGTQAIIAFVVFGRFSQPAPQALGLATLVLAGGGAQVLFLTIVRWPTPLRAQRAATATALRALSELARSNPPGSSLTAGMALDAASATLSAPALFGDPAFATLRSVVAEGLRLRVALTVIHTLLGRQGATDAAAAEAGERSLQLAAVALALAARAVEGDGKVADSLRQQVGQLGAEATALDRRSAPGSVLGPQMARRLAGLAGQLRALSELAPAAGEGAGIRSRRLHGRTNQPLQRLRDELEQMRANASLDSPAGRHAVRLAVVVPAAELISRELPLQRSYWMVVAAATVLRPEFGATFTRGTERALGTCLGVGLAGAITVALHPAGGVSVVLIGLLAWAAYATFPASFAVGFCFITALVVFLINVISPDTLATATARLLDTLVGCSIGLLAYALWPTWSRIPARQALAELLDALRAYAAAVLDALVDGRRLGEQEIRPVARQARLARTNAEATVARSLSEPPAHRIDPGRSHATLDATRRLVQAIQVLQLDAHDDRDRTPLPALAPLAGGVTRMLQMVGSAVVDSATGESTAVPDLRSSYTRFERAHEPSDDHQRAALMSELDEIVDATNGLATVAGIESVDDDPAPPVEATPT